MKVSESVTSALSCEVSRGSKHDRSKATETQPDMSCLSLQVFKSKLMFRLFVLNLNTPPQAALIKPTALCVCVHFICSDFYDNGQLYFHRPLVSLFLGRLQLYVMKDSCSRLCRLVREEQSPPQCL